MWERLREDEKLVYQVGASSWNPGSAGLLLVSMVTDEAKAEGAVEAFWQIVEELKGEGISEERLAKARRQAIVAEVNSRKTMNGQASRMGAAEVVIGGPGISTTVLGEDPERNQPKTARINQRLSPPEWMRAGNAQTKIKRPPDQRRR